MKNVMLSVIGEDEVSDFGNEYNKRILNAILSKDLKALKKVEAEIVSLKDQAPSVSSTSDTKRSYPLQGAADTYSSDGDSVSDYSLLEAIQKSSPEIVEYLLKSGANPNATSYSRYDQSLTIYPLSCAFYHNRAKIANLLLRAGAKFNGDDMCLAFSMEEELLGQELKDSQQDKMVWGETPIADFDKKIEKLRLKAEKKWEKDGYVTVKDRIAHVLKGLDKSSLKAFSEDVQGGSNPLVVKAKKNEPQYRPLDRFGSLLRELLVNEYDRRGMKFSFSKGFKKSKSKEDVMLPTI